MRIDAPSTGHIIAGRSGSPVGSISIAPIAACQCVLDHLFDQGPKAVRGDSALPACVATQRLQLSLAVPVALRLERTAPHADLPVHRGNAVLDDVHRAADHRSLGKPAQIRRASASE